MSISTKFLKHSYLPEHNQANVQVWCVVNTRGLKVLVEFPLLLPSLWPEVEVNCWRTRRSDLQIMQEHTIIMSHMKYNTAKQWPDN